MVETHKPQAAEATDTQRRILAAAREVFRAKGLAGSRMQEIADAAGINKAMLHYYFRSKQHLFEVVFWEAFEQVMPRLNEIFGSDLPLRDKLVRFAETYIALVQHNPELPTFIIHELHQAPERIERLFEGRSGPNPAPLLQQINAEVAAGTIRPIAPMDLFVDILALCVFPVAGGPMVRAVFGLSADAYTHFLAHRPQHVVDFILHALAPTPLESEHHA